MHVAEFLNNKLMYKCIHVQIIMLLAHVIIHRTYMFYFWFSQRGLRLLSSVTFQKFSINFV